MSNRTYAAALLTALALAPAAPAFAAGEILITHAKANAGNVTPGDTPGYPVTISIPGSFQLASNLFVAANKIGIQVTSANVTIDLNGFPMHGSNVAWYGIAGGVDSVTIKNGTITGFLYDGVHGTGAFWIVDALRTVKNGRMGIDCDQACLIEGSTASDNGRDGIHCSFSCRVENNIVTDNGQDGVEMYGGLLLGNLIERNGSYGLWTFPPTFIGSGNNAFAANNSSSIPANQAAGAAELHPNNCSNAPCPVP